MDIDEKQQLFGALVTVGWAWRDEALYAPNGTMWLDSVNPWPSDLRAFRKRMLGRADRLRNNVTTAIDQQKIDFEHALADVASLVNVLDELIQSDV